MLKFFSPIILQVIFRLRVFMGLDIVDINKLKLWTSGESFVRNLDETNVTHINDANVLYFVVLLPLNIAYERLDGLCLLESL